jgi:hypothetical protein
MIARNQAVRANEDTERRKKDFIRRHQRNWENKHPSPLTGDIIAVCTRAILSAPIRSPGHF